MNLLKTLEAERRFWLVECFWVSPSVLDNGIACVNRAWNVTWRKYVRCYIVKAMQDTLRYLCCDPRPQVADTLLVFLDLNDVLNVPDEYGEG